MDRFHLSLLAVLLASVPAGAETRSKEGAPSAKNEALRVLTASKGDITCGQIGVIACGQTVTGSLVLEDDCALGDGTVFDQYSFMATSGQTIIADQVSADFDSFLFLADPDFNVLASDDDGGGSLNSRIEFTFDDDGEVFLLPNSFVPAEGDYSLSVSCSGGGGGGHAVTGAISGSWFDPSHDGEGWKIEIVDSNTAVVYWFTYPPPGSTTKQAWVVGVGRIEGDKIIIDDGLIPSGASFGPDFDPADVNREPWGSFEFTFSGPNAGRMDYQGPGAFGSGSFDIVRLTSIAKAGKGVAFENVGPGISGSWFDPTHDGEGWIIEVIDAVTAVIYWFTYDDAGNQAWNIGIGQLKGNQIVVDTPLETEGAFFGPTFDPSDVVRSKWGGYVFAFDGCNSGVMSYGNQKGLGFDKFKIERLTSLQGVPCVPFDPDQPPINTLATNAADALLLNSMRMDGHETDFFGTKSAGGAPESLAAMKLMDPTGKEGDVLTDSEGMPSQITDAEEGDTVGIDQSGDPDSAVFSGLTKDGDLQSLVAIALGNLGGDGKASADKTVRDAPTRAGRATGWVSPIPTAAPPQQKGSSDSIVSVTQCDVPRDDAIVEAHVFAGSGNNAVGRPLPGIPLGQGQYRVMIPNDSTAATVSPATSCREFVDTADDSCDFVDRINALDIPEICLLIASAMVENTADTSDLLAAADFLESCAFALYATKLSCDSAGGSAFNAGTSRDNFVCTDVAQQNNSINNLLPEGTSDVRLEVSVKLPGRGRVDIESQTNVATAAIDGPYPDFAIDLQEDVTITDFFTVPLDPAPGESYTATARIACAPQNTRVTVSVEGTDGFMDSAQCTINGSGDCNLGVPGATAGVRDTITVTVADGPSRQIQIIF